MKIKFKSPIQIRFLSCLGSIIFLSIALKVPILLANQKTVNDYVDYIINKGSLSSEGRVFVIEDAIKNFYLSCGVYPNSFDDLLVCPPELDAKWAGPYISKRNLLDPWGNKYLYTSDGSVVEDSTQISDEDKAEILIRIYRIQNNKSDKHARSQILQKQVLGQLCKIPTKKCLKQVSGILSDYLAFMNNNGKDDPKQKLSIAVANLIDAHIEESAIRGLASKYLKSSSFPEWIKGRIATSLLRYNVGNIKDSSDPDFAKRLDLVMATACLPTVDDMLKAPKRILRSSIILRDVTKDRQEVLVDYISEEDDLTDVQKYFLAYAFYSEGLAKTREDRKITSRDLYLINKAHLWHEELKVKTDKVENADQLLDYVAQQWDSIADK